MPNDLHLIVFDFETIGKLTHVGGKLDTSIIEPASLAALAIDPITLTPDKWTKPFHSLMRPEGEDWKTRVDTQAIMVNKLQVDDIDKAPPRQEVWLQFAEWVRQFNPKGKGPMSAPIPAGKNIRNFDLPICEFLCQKYGTHDTKGLQTIFNRKRGSMWGEIVDLEDYLWMFFEGPHDGPKTRGMDNIREYFGLDSRGAHTALVDVYQEAEMICRFQRKIRQVAKNIKFEKSMADYRLPEDVACLV